MKRQPFGKPHTKIQHASKLFVVIDAVNILRYLPKYHQKPVAKCTLYTINSAIAR